MIAHASAIVVAGGQSSRLGYDKRQLRLFMPRTLLEETIARVSTLTKDVVVVVAESSAAYEQLPARIVQDVVPGAGPLNALCAGLSAVEHEYAVVVACDLPFLSVELLHGLLAQPRGYDLLVPRRSDGRLEMLHAIYRTTCLETLRRRLAERRLRLADVIQDVSTCFVDEPLLRQYDPPLTSFVNINTPEDLRAVIRRGSG